jgi:hypothetical protein
MLSAYWLVMASKSLRAAGLGPGEQVLAGHVPDQVGVQHAL